MGRRRQQQQLHHRRSPESRFLGRPMIVVIMSIFLFLQGIYFLVASFFSWLGVAVIFIDASRGSLHLLHGVLYFVVGVFSIIFAASMFLLQRWAFWATIIIACLNLAVSVYILVNNGWTAIGHIISVIVSLVILYFFLRYPDVRRAFFRPAPVHSHA